MRSPCFLLPLAFVLPAMAATYHVSPGGIDTNNGLSPATAWATLQHAANTAVAGDSVIVHAGTYTGFAAMTHSGTAQASIVFTAMGAEVLIGTPCTYNNLDGINVENVQHVVIEGFTVIGMPRTGIRTALSEHITIRGNHCHDNYRWGIFTGFAEHVVIEHNVCSGSEDEHGIYVSNSADHPIIRYNHGYNNNACGIHMNGDVSLGGDGVISGAQVYGNIIHGNGVGGGSGINCDGVVGAQIFNNLLYDNHASGISLFRIDGGAPSTGNRVYNNTIVNAADGRWCINITEGCTDNQVLNNILINQHAWRGSITIAADALPGFVCGHNIVTPRFSTDGGSTVLDLDDWQQLGFADGTQVAVARSGLFVSPGSDFHPASGTAQMVDAGTGAVAAVVAMDLDGMLRPQGTAFDVGCYEFPLSTAIGQPAISDGFSIREGLLFLPDAHGATHIQVLDAAGRTVFMEQIPSGAQQVVLPQVKGTALVVLHAVDGSRKWVERVFLP